MPAAPSAIPIVTLVFALGGLAKGIAGMGLPTVAMGLLGLWMAPSDAAALIVVPSLVTNLWQYLSGRERLAIIRRTWSMLLMICFVTWAGASLITGAEAATATLGLGVVLILYATLGVTKIRLFVPPSYEAWLSPVVGALTGIITGATGVFVMPALPYLQALGFDKDELVLVLGLSFTVSTVALAAGLASHGAFHIANVGASALCTVPALIGMRIGQMIRTRVEPATFRMLFLISLLLLGADLVVRSAF
jgi:uncharacterized membrane protein YfcA